MTYREPDPDRVAEAEAQLAADEKIERAAAAGRTARAAHEHGIEKRLLRERQRSPLRGLMVWTGGMVAYMGAVFGAGVAVPIGIAIGAGAATLGGFGLHGLDRLWLRRENAWIARHPFPVLGYVEVLKTPLVVTAITAKVTLASVEPDDRERVIDLLGALDTVDPVVTVDGNVITIEVLVAGLVKPFVRALIDRVLAPLHDARKITVAQLYPSTADPATPYDVYR